MGTEPARGAGRTRGRATADSGTATVGRRRFLRAAGAGAAGVAGWAGTAAGQEAITVGVLAPAPTNDPIGASIANGARLAAEELNADGGVAGSQVEVAVRDTEEDPSTGRARYQELTLGEGVDVTVGIFTSEVLLNVLDDVAQTGTVHMTAGAATPRASAMVNENYDRYRYHFRTGPINATHLGRHQVEFASQRLDDLGWESVAVLVEDFEWTNPVSAALDEGLDDAGVEVAMTRRYAGGTENFTPIYDEVESGDADAALVAMAHTGTAALVQWARQQRPFAFGGIHVPSQLPSYYRATDGAARYTVTQNTATPQSEITEQTVPFAERYRESFDGYPVYTGYIAYDAVNQYASVVEDAGSTAADDVVAGLEDSSYVGTVGTVEYYPPDHRFAHDVVYGRENVWPIYQQWQAGEDGGGTQEVIFPEGLATADYQSPPWV